MSVAGIIVAASWAVAAVVLLRLRSKELLWLWSAAMAASVGATVASEDFAATIPFVAFAILCTAPDGRPRTRLVNGVLVAGVATTAAAVALDAVVAQSLLLGAIGVFAFARRYRVVGPVDRARMQWIGWGAVVSASGALAVWLVHALIDWPDSPGPVIAAGTVVAAVATGLSAVEPLAVRVDRLLVRTIEAGALLLMVGAVYLVVVLGFGEGPDDSERQVLGLSVVAAAIAALLYGPTRTRALEFANRRVYGERKAPDEPLQTFGARMSRAIPLDELLLQLAESLKKSMQLRAAEVWTGSAGVLERSASVPFREPTAMRLADEALSVVARAHVSGNAWAQVWLPGIAAEHDGQLVRVAPMSHSGELLGLLVCTRNIDAVPFSDEEDRLLTELARTVALALHNSALDSALQASLDELQVANEELRASRARIVATADQSRRQIERNLHDGAQQHLVALAVKLGLAKQLLDADPSVLGPMLDELRADAQETLTQLRELAHGIYPPLLIDRGLEEALRAAANRAVLPTEVTAKVERYQPDVEAAIYFCCLEAMQNAGKHAGEGARINVSVEECDGRLCFEVADSGAGFDATGPSVRGHGFINMADRVGAIGGTIAVESSPGKGTKVRGEIPLS